MKQYKKFKAFVPNDFEEKLIEYWCKNENMTKEQACAYYHNDDFKQLVKRISGKKCVFLPDLGYSNDDHNGVLCFEEIDDNFVIPVIILEDAA